MKVADALYSDIGMKNCPTMTWACLSQQFGITHDALLADVRAKVGDHTVHAVYIGGSIADGYSNARSDVDVYARLRREGRSRCGDGEILEASFGRESEHADVHSDGRSTVRVCERRARMKNYLHTRTQNNY